jgi:hypothetical protein
MLAILVRWSLLNPKPKAQNRSTLIRSLGFMAITSLSVPRTRIIKLVGSRGRDFIGFNYHRGFNDVELAWLQLLQNPSGSTVHPSCKLALNTISGSRIVLSFNAAVSYSDTQWASWCRKWIREKLFPLMINSTTQAEL